MAPPPPPPPPIPNPYFRDQKNSPPYDHHNNDQIYLYHRSNYDLNNKIMLTALISLSFVVALVIALHIYARCAFRRQARRGAVIRSLGLNAAHVHSGEPPKTGLDPAVIASLPIFVYKQTTKGGSGQYDEDDDASTECAVCLSLLEDQEMARFLPNCKHTFHADCIDKWLSSRSTCPICRTEAEPRVQPEQREGPVRGAPTAAPIMFERENSTLLSIEGISSSDDGTQSSAKLGGSTSRLSSFRRMLSRDRSSRRIQSVEFQEEGFDQDLERQ